MFFAINMDYEDSVFCVGYDTMVRVMMEKYYEKGYQDIERGLGEV